MRPLKTTAAAVILAITAVTVPFAWEQHRRASCVPAAGVHALVQDRENGGSPHPTEASVSRPRAGEPSTSRDTPPGDHLERLIPQAPAPGNLVSGSAVRPSPAGEPPLEAGCGSSAQTVFRPFCGRFSAVESRPARFSGRQRQATPPTRLFG